MAKEKKLDFAETVAKLEKDYGKGTVMAFSDKVSDTYDIIETGSISLDHALGIGGYARGRMYEMMGWEGTGKSTLCGHAVANCQEKYPDEKVIYIDGEHALDVGYFRKLGVDVDNMTLSQPGNAEEAFNIAYSLIKTGQVSLAIIDSDTALKPKSEIEGDIGDSAIGKKARLNGQAYLKLHNAAVENNTCLIIISQFREKIGVMFGSPVTTSGGNALRFYSDVRMEVGKSFLKEDEQTYGTKTKIKITKNKMAVPFQNCEFTIKFGIGIDKTEELFEKAKELEIIKVWGDKVTLLDNGAGGETKYTMDEFLGYLREDKDMIFGIKKDIQEKWK